jgi:hypothetical protein
MGRDTVAALVLLRRTTVDIRLRDEKGPERLRAWYPRLSHLLRRLATRASCRLGRASSSPELTTVLIRPKPPCPGAGRGGMAAAVLGLAVRASEVSA